MDKNVNALMDEVTYERLRGASFETRKSMSEIIREALALWFEKREGAGPQ
jgi:Ribbon-helix-helix protein, copG family